MVDFFQLTDEQIAEMDETSARHCIAWCELQMKRNTDNIPLIDKLDQLDQKVRARYREVYRKA